MTLIERTVIEGKNLSRDEYHTMCSIVYRHLLVNGNVHHHVHIKVSETDKGIVDSLRIFVQQQSTMFLHLEVDDAV